jgi:hypothetical protein
VHKPTPKLLVMDFDHLREYVPEGNATKNQRLGIV